MKKFIVVTALHLKNDGLYSNISPIFNTEEEAKECLKKAYEDLKEESVDYVFNIDDFDDNSYYIVCSSNDGYSEWYDGHIEEIEVEPSANDYFSWYCKDYLEQYLNRKCINLSEEEIKSMSEHLTDNLLNSSHIWDEIDTEIEDNIAIDFVEQYKNKHTNIEYLRYNKGDTLFKVGKDTTDSDDIHHIKEDILNTNFIKVNEWYEEG